MKCLESDAPVLFDPETQLPPECGLADLVNDVDPHGVVAGIQGGQGVVPAESQAWQPGLANGDRDRWGRFLEVSSSGPNDCDGDWSGP